MNNKKLNKRIQELEREIEELKKADKSDKTFNRVIAIISAGAAFINMIYNIFK